MKRTGPTNQVLQNLISDLKSRSREQNANIWDRIAEDLGKPTRQRRAVNLSKIDRYTGENEIVVVPGKVLGSGALSHKITISAFQFSESAKEKILKAGSQMISLAELTKENPKGKRIKIIG